MSKKHYAIYGNTILRREYCMSCKGMALVVDGILQCCDKPVQEKATRKKRVMCEATARRKRPSPQLQKKILEMQGNRCLYCDVKFGDLLYRRSTNKIYPAYVNFDHLVPYSYSRNNKLNFVAACQSCNGIKSNKIFDTVEEVRHYVAYHRKKKGISTLEEAEVPSVPEGVHV